MTGQTTRRSRRKTAKADAAAPDPQRDVEGIRGSLLGALIRIEGNANQCWRSCEHRICRRRRACFALGNECPGLPPLPPKTPEEEMEEAGLMSELKRALRQRIEEQRAE